MNWNPKPGSSAIPPPSYPRRQSPSLEQPFRSPLGSAPQSSFTYPGQNPEAGVFLGSSETGAQLFGHPQVQPRNYGTTNMQSGTMLMSQTSVEKVTYAGIRGSRHLDHNMQVPAGLSHSTWVNPAPRSSALPHQGTSGTLQSSFRMKAPNVVKALQNQFVTSDTYPMQLQMPVSSSHTPVSCQGSSRLNPPSVPEFPGHWTQQPHTPSGLACSEYRLPQQPYTYPSPSFVPEPTLQKPNPLPSLMSPVRNTHPSAAGLPLQTQQSVPRQPFPCTTAQPDARVTSYSCSYMGQPVPSTQQLPKHTVAELPQSQEPHTPSKFRPIWPKQCENLGTLGNFCSVKVKSNSAESFYEPTRASVSGMHTVPHSQEKRSAACVLPPNSPVDTNVTKEKLVRDIKTLVEIKNKFSELARKIKINKELLVAAGCIKTTNMSYNDSAPNSESAPKETDKVSSGSLLSLLTTEISENKELDHTQGTALSPGTLAPSCRKCGALGSGLHNPLCPEMLPVSAHGQGLVQVQTSSQTPTVERTQLSGSNTSFSLGSSLSIEQNASANLEMPLAFPPQSSGDCMAKHLHKHPIILSLLEVGDHAVPEKLLKDAQETLQNSKLPGSEARPRVPVTGQQLDLRTPEAPGPHNKSRMAIDQALPLPVSASGGVTNSERPCSMDLLATCLSLWKNSPVEPARDVPREDPGATLAASGSCSQSGLVAGGSVSTLASSSQDSVHSVAPQNYEPPGMTMSKGTELQVAVVTPLILSSAKSLAVKGTSPETVYPMIKEDSVCSLQICLAEEIGGPAALKVSLEEPTAGVASGTDSPKVRTPENSEDKSYLCPRKQAQADSGRPLPGDRDGERASEDSLQIDSICSLVKGDTSYNPQIAEIFGAPLCPVEERQEQPDSLAEDRGKGIQEVSVSGQIPQSSDAPQSLEPPSQHLPETELLQAPLHPENGNCTATDANGLECHMEKTSLALDPGPVTAAEDGPSEGTAPSPTEGESPEEETPVLYLHDQLSELLKEFPYGVEPVNTCVAPESCHLPGHATVKPDEMPTAAGQIQITILNSEQMKVLFPKQDLQEPDCEAESPKRELESEDGAPPTAGSEDGCTPATSSEDGGSPGIRSEDGGSPSADSEDGTSLSAGSEDRGPQTTGCEDGSSSATGSEDRVSLGTGSEDGSPPTQISAEIQGGPPTQAQGEQSSKKDFQKDDMPCCALGWLSAIYEGVPQCQCSISKVRSTKPTKRKSGRPHSSQETLSHKQGGFSKNDSSLVPPEKKRPLLGHPGKDRDRVKARPCTQGKNQQALPAQHLHSESKQPSPRHPNVGKRLTSEVYLSPSSAQARNSVENRPRKHPVPSLQPSKAETSLLCQNTQEPLPPGPRKLIPKAPLPGYKAWDKRKLEEGAALDSATKRRKIDKPEKGRGVGSSSSGKPWGSESLPKEQRHKKELQEKASVSADGSPKAQRSMSPAPKHKHREATAAKASRKDPRKVRPRETQLLFLGKPVPVHTRPRGPRPALEEASRACPSFGKSPQPQHSQESRMHGSRPGKPKERLRTEKNQSHGHLGRSRLAGATGSMAPLAKDHRKLYLNRIGFQCTERESICLTRLDPSPRKPHREESSRKGAPSMKEGTEPPGMLEFKLCPEVMIPKAGHKDEHPLLKHGPRKDRLPTQVSGIKTKKEDWLKCVTEERKLPDATQEMGSRAVTDPRPPKRTLSADGIDGIQRRPAKDFKATFQTYKKMYMEKRSRSLGSSPLK
ncbi:retroelement silencing factor 1 [Suncus etruscus]|uniref:retroelement silencing factor 1 n=1 Tax=Suncus etruscus TaxID=109475 RepID=UPI00210FA32B|nr:retroelement silencing factor 1 [Suncus etruscus]